MASSCTPLPSQSLMDSQELKQSCVILGCPLLTEEQVLRYKDAEMEDRYRKFGGLARVVWGMPQDVNRHVGRLMEGLKDRDKFLDDVKKMDYLEGPHRYWYIEIQKDEDGKFHLRSHGGRAQSGSVIPLHCWYRCSKIS